MLNLEDEKLVSPEESDRARISVSPRPATNLARILSFGIVGGASSLLYFILASGFTLVFPGHETEASVTAYLACIGFSFVLQKMFTFSSDGKVSSEFLRFAIFSILGLVLSSAIVYLSVSKFGLSPYLSYVIVIATIPILSYVAFSQYVFKREKVSLSSIGNIQ